MRGAQGDHPTKGRKASEAKDAPAGLLEGVLVVEGSDLRGAYGPEVFRHDEGGGWHCATRREITRPREEKLPKQKMRRLACLKGR